MMIKKTDFRHVLTIFVLLLIVLFSTCDSGLGGADDDAIPNGDEDLGIYTWDYETDDGETGTIEVIIAAETASSRNAIGGRTAAPVVPRRIAGECRPTGLPVVPMQPTGVITPSDGFTNVNLTGGNKSMNFIACNVEYTPPKYTLKKNNSIVSKTTYRNKTDFDLWAYRETMNYSGISIVISLEYYFSTTSYTSIITINQSLAGVSGISSAWDMMKATYADALSSYSLNGETLEISFIDTTYTIIAKLTKMYSNPAGKQGPAALGATNITSTSFTFGPYTFTKQ